MSVILKGLLSTFAVLFFISAEALGDGDPKTLIAVGDEFYKKRADGASNDWATTGNIKQALDAYLKAYEMGERTEDVVERIMRSTYFYATFAQQDIKEQKAAFQRSIEIGEGFLKTNPNSVAINYQMAGSWGRWGEANGIIASARKGVAQRVRDYGEKTVALDSSFAEGGGYRTLGRLHFKAPRIPLILSWPSKDESLKYLSRAVATGPNNLTNHLFYAETLFELDVYNKAIEHVDLVLNAPINPERLVEDARDKKDALALKDKILKKTSK
ncbi:MAG: hypothetical protein HY880_00590 [Deltaproteobacteria bacterium]|nr:hypothetical protein [Deltaproteobacteria bacterium]